MPAAPVDIPHHSQEEDHTCGPAAVKMVLDALWGVRVDEESLAERLGTRADIGTRQRTITAFLQGLGLDAQPRHTDTTLADLRGLLRDHVVIVCYWLAPEDTDHYAVVTAMDDVHITLADPWTGPESRWPLAWFDEHWYGDASVEGRRDRWLVAVRPPTSPPF